MCKYTPAEKIEALRRLGVQLYEGDKFVKNAPSLLNRLLERSVEFAHTFLSTDSGAWQAMDRVLWESDCTTILKHYPNTGTVDYEAYGLIHQPQFKAIDESTQAAVYSVYMEFIREREEMKNAS